MRCGAKKKMSLPKSPKAWASRIIQLLRVLEQTHGLTTIPLDVAAIATEFSRQLFPEEPITFIQGGSFQSFNGALLQNPDGSGEWGIIYNQDLSRGRMNFTIAHEFGHYLMHRDYIQNGKIECLPREDYEWNSEYGRMEREADEFASHLLIPIDDLRSQIEGEDICLSLMDHLASRYNVSLTSIILKWLEVTHHRAMFVFGRDGYIDWAWSSIPLMRSRIYYKAKQELIELPPESLAFRCDPFHDNEAGKRHQKGVWIGNEPVLEMTRLSQNGITMTILLYPHMQKSFYDFEETQEKDVFDIFSGS